ncbi:MAG: hypothetical protein JST30_02910 [Armatimonadetes bacterium]|nr:hypothetical protein [Armatimonadota bacterium]
MSKGIKDAPRDVYLCFSPRHAIHASDGKTTVDVLVCFECLNGRYESPGLRGSFRINTYPEPVFNAFLKAAGVPLAPKER